MPILIDLAIASVILACAYGIFKFVNYRFDPNRKKLNEKGDPQ